jgi:hypothetical protein
MVRPGGYRAPAAVGSLPRDGREFVIPAAVAVVLALWYAGHAPLVGDLAAQTARAQLFSRSGDVAWWTSWYGGLATSTYSLTTPALLGWLGPVLLGAASLVATPIAAFPLLQMGRRPVAGGVVLALAAAANVVSGRITFAVGVVAAVLSLSAAVRGHPWWAAALLLLTMFTSPVAGLLGLLVMVAVAIVTPRRADWLKASIGGLLGIATLWWLSGGVTGYEPFAPTGLLYALGAAAVVLIAPVGRTLRGVAALTMVALVAAYAVPTAVGSNMTRLVLLGAAPAVVANARLRPHWLILMGLLAGVFPSGNLIGGLADASRPGSSEQFVTALRGRLSAEPLLRDHRLEVVDVASHWPSARLLPTVTLARGWERQTDEELNPELYDGPPLTATAYRMFLDRNAVAFVAVPRNAPLDFGTQREAALIAAGVPYLHQVWVDADWRLYAVSRPAAVVPAPATRVQLTDTGLTFTAPAAGIYAMRLRWSPYFVVKGGSVSQDAAGDLVVEVGQAGRYEVHAVWRIP